MHMASMWNRTFGASDPCPIPATFHVLNKYARDTFGVAVAFARDPGGFVRLWPRDQDHAVYHVLRAPAGAC
jgi:hypothetical protein